MDYDKINTQKVRTIILIVAFIFILILGILIMMFLKRSGECELNPFVYGAKKTYEQGMEISCSCTPYDPKYNNFYFDKDNIQTGYINENFLNPNLLGE